MQNCQGWTAVSNLKKLRGFGEKFWAKLQLLLNNSGPRVESGKSQGLFSKKSRPNRYLQIRTVGSRSGGLDLYGHDLITGVRASSDAQDRLGAWDDSAERRRPCSAEGLRRSTPNSAVRGLIHLEIGLGASTRHG